MLLQQVHYDFCDYGNTEQEYKGMMIEARKGYGYEIVNGKFRAIEG